MSSNSKGHMSILARVRPTGALARLLPAAAQIFGRKLYFFQQNINNF